MQGWGGVGGRRQLGQNSAVHDALRNKKSSAETETRSCKIFARKVEGSYSMKVLIISSSGSLRMGHLILAQESTAEESRSGEGSLAS